MAFGALAMAAVLDFGVQAVAGAAAILLQTEKFYDLTGSLTFVLVALQTYNAGISNTRKLVATYSLVAARTYLAFFLFSRVLREGKDGRFDKIRGNPTRFAVAWFLQGVWVFLVALPTLLINTSKRHVSLGLFGYLATAIFATGLAFEVIADIQKTVFKLNPDNDGKFCSVGLWSISRHPNYFGEIMLTTGLYLLSLPVLRGWGHLAVLSPLFTAFLLLKVSGVPLVERSLDKRFGEDVTYIEYKKTTAMLVPYLY